MFDLIRDTKQMLQENYSSGHSFLISQESHLFFASPEKQIINKTVNVSDGFADLRRAIKKADPRFTLHDTTPSELTAKTTIPVAIFLFTKEETSLTFYKNLAKAIDTRLAKAKLIDAARIEKENTWDAFFKNNAPKWVVAEGEALQDSFHAKQFLQKNSSYFGKAQLISLYPCHIYLSDAATKKTLWEILCHTLQSS